MEFVKRRTERVKTNKAIPVYIVILELMIENLNYAPYGYSIDIGVGS